MSCDPGLAALAAGRSDDLPVFFIGNPEVYNASGCQKFVFRGYLWNQRVTENRDPKHDRFFKGRTCSQELVAAKIH